MRTGGDAAKRRHRLRLELLGGKCVAGPWRKEEIAAKRNRRRVIDIGGDNVSRGRLQQLLKDLRSQKNRKTTRKKVVREEKRGEEMRRQRRQRDVANERSEAGEFDSKTQLLDCKGMADFIADYWTSEKPTARHPARLARAEAMRCAMCRARIYRRVSPDRKPLFEIRPAQPRHLYCNLSAKKTCCDQEEADPK